MIECEAWDCIGKHSEKIDRTHLIRIAGGRTLYAHAAIAVSRKCRGEFKIRLARIATDPLRQINRYVEHNTMVELIPIERQGDV